MNVDPFAHVPVFPERRRGYDSEAVDQFILALQAQLTEANTRAAEAEDRIRTVALQAPVGDGGAATTLQAAKETADKTIADARNRATLVLDEARTRADALVAEAQEKLVHAKSVNEKIEQMKVDTAAYVAAAEQHAVAMRDQANGEREQVLADVNLEAEQARTHNEAQIAHANELARAECDRLIDLARSDADRITTDATDEADRIRAEARSQVDAAKAAIDQAERQASAASAAEAAKVRDEAEQSAQVVAAEAEQSARLVAAEAERTATAMLADAKTESDRLLATSRVEAHDIVATATEEAASVRDEAERFVSSSHVRAEEIVVEAKQAALNAATEITSAAERQRDELLEQVARLSATAAEHEATIDTHRAAIAFAVDELQVVLDGPLSKSDLIDLDAMEGDQIPVEMDLRGSASSTVAHDLRSELFDNSI